MMISKEQISAWFDRGIEKEAAYMLIICDTYDYDDYPVYVTSANECLKKYKYPGEMQRVMEVYDLAKDKSEQMNNSRVMNLPSTIN